VGTILLAKAAEKFPPPYVFPQNDLFHAPDAASVPEFREAMN